jgi:hypothetical protein
MAQLHFTCPATRHRAATGIQIDVQSLRASWHSTLKVNCPHCGGQHDIAVRDTYVDSAHDELLLRPSPLRVKRHTA